MRSSTFAAAAGLAAGLGLAALRPAAQEAAPAPAPAPAAPAAPAPPALPGVDLWTPDLRALHAAAQADRQRVEQVLGEKLQELFSEQEAELARAYEEKKLVRNVKGMMVARAALETVQQAAAALREKGRTEPLQNERREVAELLAPAEAQRKAIEAQAADARKRADELRYPAFEAAVKGQPDGAGLADAALRAAFEAWSAAGAPAAGAPGEPAPAPTGTVATADGTVTGATADGTATGATSQATAPPAAPPEFFATAGAGRQWETFGTWTAEMMGPDIVRIPLWGQAEESAGSQLNILSGGTSKWSYKPAKPVPAGTAALRLRRVAGRLAVDVVDWPSARGGGVLVVRTPNAAKFPAACGFELQADPSAPPPAGATGPGSAAATVEVPVQTDPPGATVHVDGQLYTEAGRAVTTPCRLKLTPGPHRLRLSLAGHSDKEFADFRAAAGQALQWRFAAERGRELPAKRVRVDAAKGWQESGIRVEPTQKFRVQASGMWSCGARMESCGPDGYPDTPAFRHYYADAKTPLRQTDKAPYGALLVRVGWRDTAPPGAVGKEKEFAARGFGELFFDVNEATNEVARKDNRGGLDVTVTLSPVER